MKVVIYTEQQGEDDNAEQIVKIFVEFQTSKRKYKSPLQTPIKSSLFSEAEKAVESLHGRYFGGRVLKAEPYDQTAYLADDLSG